ncbi:MAG: L,D-transpeptidase family protein [Bradymonadales bacterium]|nr:L,D-transpeptidase family protein [Bradymonadales bacterium]
MLKIPLALAVSLSLTGLVVVFSCCNNGALNEHRIEAPSTHDLAVQEVDRFAVRLAGELAARIDQVGGSPALATAIASHELTYEADERLHTVLAEIYQERGFLPVFVEDGQITEPGRALLHLLEEAWLHGLNPLHYGVDRAGHDIALLQELRPAVELPAEVTITGTDREALVAYIEDRPWLLELEETERHRHLLEAVNEPQSNDQPLAPGITEQIDRIERTHLSFRQTQEELELSLALGFLRYAYDMRYFNPAWFEVPDEEPAEVLEGLVKQALKDAFLTGLGAEGFAAVLESLVPPHQQYGRLLEAHRRYREMAAAGGWEEVEFVDIRAGREYDMIPALRRRLAAEGYFEGDLESREYDRELRRALIEYQVTHQFDDDGRMTESLVRSLNASALRRAQQIAVALQRWRESQIGNASYYVFVNIPDFHVEVWRNGNRDMRFRSIVGSTDTRFDRETGSSVFYRATPEVHRNLRYIVFNPYWTVPQDIMINEYDPNLRDDPFWYENNGYEVIVNPDGSRWVRQLPGPENALGEVKFLFPNPFDVYMHDTPLKSLFRRSFRAFSHGCIRIQHPMELAEYLLGNDRGWSRERIDQERAPGTEIWVTLRRPLPVHVEYYVVRVDDEGRAHFLSDMYRRDQPRMEALVQEEMNRGTHGARRAILRSIEAASRSTSEATPPTRSASLDSSPSAPALQLE